MQRLASIVAGFGALGFDALCVAALVHAVRRGGRQRWVLVLAACLLGIQVSAVRVAVELGFDHRLFALASTALFLGSGYALWAYADMFLGSRLVVRRWLLGLSIAVWLSGTVVEVPLQPGTLRPAQAAVSAALVLVWSVMVAVPSMRMWRTARRQPPIVKHRLRALASAYAAIIGILVLSLVGRPGSNPAVALAVWTSGLTLLPLMWAGFLPPQWLQRRWEREEEEAARARVLLEHMPAVVWTADRDQRLTSLQGAGVGDLGVRQELLGRSVMALFPRDETFRDAVALALCGKASNVDAAQRGRRWDVRIEPLCGADGTPVGLVGLATDITGRKETEEELAEAQALAHIGSWTWQVDPRRVRWSAEMYRILGVAPDFEISMQDFISFVHPDDRERVFSFTQEVLTNGGGSFEVDYRIVRPDGVERWVRGRGVGFPDETGRVQNLRGTIQDITRSVEAEQALREAYEIERQAAERLRVLDEMKNSLLAAVSHELRTPLAVVLGLAQTLRLYDLRDDPQRMSDILEKIEDNARRLERLLLDLLDLDRLSRGVMEPLRRPAWLGSLVGRVVGAVELRGRLVEMEVDDEIAYVDVAEAERILENLLVNAIKHTPPDTRIWVRGQRVAGGTLLSVEDEGEGIPDEMKDKIFDPFHRGSTYATGTGIGLSLVAKFAELHGGRAWVEDRPGGGAAFRVLLPHEPGDETPSVESAKRSRPRPSVRGV